MLDRCLQKLVSLFSRSQRARSFLVLKQYRLGYCRIPKSANSSIKRALFHLHSYGEVARTDAHPFLPGVNKDSFWRKQDRTKVALLSPRDFVRCHPDFMSFTVVRNPFARIVSCYFNKIVLSEGMPPFFRIHGFRKEMNFDEFVARACDLRDADTDVHLISQAHLTSLDGRVVPRLVGRFEHLDADWQMICEGIVEAGGPRLPPLSAKGPRTAGSRPCVREMFRSGRTVERVLNRYHDDFDLFYPDARDPSLLRD